MFIVIYLVSIRLKIIPLPISYYDKKYPPKFKKTNINYKSKITNKISIDCKTFYFLSKILQKITLHNTHQYW